MKIPFTKAHGAMNDFLLTWRSDAPAGDLAEVARAICHRHTGAGADGWMLVERRSADAEGAIHLYNSDGSEAEISGNGTRCAAAFLVANGVPGPVIRIATGAGLKRLELMERSGEEFLFRMEMGRPAYTGSGPEDTLDIAGKPVRVFIADVGNPQCAVFVDDFDLDWRSMGRAIESHARFPRRTNVSFIRVVDRNTIDVRFYERGAGETMSSGTGSTGAAFASVHTGQVESPVRVLTPAGPLMIVERAGEYILDGPAVIVATGEFYAPRSVSSIPA